MSNSNEVVVRYLAAWNEPEAKRRRELVAKDSDFYSLRCQPFLYQQHLIRAATAGFFLLAEL